MAVASNMPWQQTLFGCFGNAPPVQDRAPVARREDSAHQHSSSSGLSRSHKSSDPASDSNNDTHMAHVAMSDPFPRRSPAAPVSGQEASLRSASIRVDRHAGVDAARQQARRQRIKQASSREEPRCPSAELEDWHRLKRFAFVGDICSSRGAGTVTKLMLNRKTEALVSVKFLDRRAGAVDGATEGEIMNHRKLQSPHIARLKEVFLTDKHLAVVTEHAPGGPLFRHIVHKGGLLEADARRYFRQLLAGIAHCHAQGVYHRDLRLDALRLDACDDLVLTDFGYSAAKLTASGEMADLRNPAASPAYTPPEVLLGHSIVNAKYDGEVLDIWACGIILYVMLFGGFPFEDSAGPRSTRSIIKRLVRLQYKFPSGASPEAKDLLARIFVASKAKRISLADMMSSPWVTDKGALPPVPSESLQGLPRDLKAPSFDLLSGLGASTPLAASAPSAAFGQAPPETPSAFESLRSPSIGSLFTRRSGRERQQSDTDIRELVRKAMKGT